MERQLYFMCFEAKAMKRQLYFSVLKQTPLSGSRISAVLKEKLWSGSVTPFLEKSAQRIQVNRRFRKLVFVI